MNRNRVTHTATERRLVRLPSGSDVSVTVHRYEGGPGPTVYVQAAQHGIELNGTAALRRLHDHLLSTEIAGTVLVVPIANPRAFDHRSYVTPQALDAVNSNMNRVWPGNEEGTLQERAARRLWCLFEDADAVIDLHTGAADMLEHVRFHDDSKALAAAFDTEHLLVDTLEEDAADRYFSGKLRTAAARAGIPAITPELSNSRQVDHSAVQRGVAGIRNVLREMNVLDGEPDTPSTRTVFRSAGDCIRAEESGFFEPNPDIEVGDRVSPETALGAVYNPSTFEELQTVTARERGIVYSLTRESVVAAGEKLADIAEVV
ncbi:succinylglutamate desuccinylase/aspartoacylase family protein [Natrinema versiforme]|uniref:Succinylglutamate desuccinylase/aspartoacylase n=1 Tax=Natrinema versiforme JCM 10478 TaxID=1227496 RepID=L9XMW8_9EURY|nr:succinylglutamate desuccinylase/aspartoacylase family protein [Natrinema versiforme]ELY62907.1 Succinylglutamate desuccinylase/aspartoacylase [Natrinema versiforme JCM 10478]